MNYTIIASAFRADLDCNTNLERHENMLDFLKRNYLPLGESVIGVYQEDGQDKASRELSVKIDNLSFMQADMVKKYFLDTSSQDCVLVIDNNTCYLVGSDWGEELGKWTKVSREAAKRNKCYTLDSNGNYFIAM